MEILPAFASLSSVLLGKEDTRQFLLEQGELVCVRSSCEGCPYVGSCESEEVEVQKTIIPNMRRGVGLEEREFLLLKFKEGHNFESFPKELWGNQSADLSYYDASNLHYLLTSPYNCVFQSIKGQLRYYDSRDSFLASPYAEYFEVWDKYEPFHKLASMDFSAIEPRVSTMVSKEPEWVKVFEGEVKQIYCEVRGLDSYLGGKEVPHLIKLADRTFCYLEGELDKEEYKNQCAGCAVRSECKIVQAYYKNVPTDWHGVNASALYGTEFTQPKDKFRKKELRNIAKVVGLALCYGGTAYAVSKNLSSTVEYAQEKIDSFFKNLPTLRDYMTRQRMTVVKERRVYNAFAGTRNMSRLVDSKKETQKERNRDKSAAERVALNFPIQSTAAVILKYAMIVAVEEIEKQGWCPVYGLSIPSKLGSLRYTDIVCAVIHSVHDELVNLVQDSSLDKVIPPLYRRMQIKDILARATLKVRYSLELDCEYDNTRSWTATEALDTARIYCLMEQQRNGVPIVLQEVEKRYIIPIVQVKYTDIQQHAGLLQDLLALRTQAGQETSCLVSIEHDSKVCVMELSCKLETLLGIGVPSRLGDTLCRV